MKKWLLCMILMFSLVGCSQEETVVLTPVIDKVEQELNIPLEIEGSMIQLPSIFYF